MTSNIHIIDLISSIVDKLRFKTSVVNFVEGLNGIYTISIANTGDLQNGDYIEITLSDLTIILNVQIIEVVNTTDFKVKLSVNLDLSSAQIKSNKPYFHYEKYLEQSNSLAQKDSSLTYRNQKYPLFHLLLDISETRDINDLVYTQIPELVIIISVQTDPKKTSEWRNQNTFENILRPLYTKFINELNDSYFINKLKKDKIQHTYIERFYLGTATRNQNQYNDFVDAIELRISNLSLKNLLNCR
jgi:hypothetical protein